MDGNVMNRRKMVTPASFLVLSALVGCGAQTTGEQGTGAPADSNELAQEPTMASPPSTDPAEGAPPVDADAAANAYPGISVDYEPVSTSELTEASQVVVTGEILGFVPGPTLYAEDARDPNAVPTSVMSVKVLDVFKGEPPADGRVYVLQGRPAPPADQVVEDALPSGTRVGLYLNPASWQEGTVVGDPGAGRPDGAAL